MKAKPRMRLVLGLSVLALLLGSLVLSFQVVGVPSTFRFDTERVETEGYDLALFFPKASKISLAGVFYAPHTQLKDLPKCPKSTSMLACWKAYPTRFSYQSVKPDAKNEIHWKVDKRITGDFMVVGAAMRDAEGIKWSDSLYQVELRTPNHNTKIPAEFMIAYTGDTENGSGFQKVSDLIRTEGADITAIIGDYDYGNSPSDYAKALDDNLVSHGFAVTGAIGNHEDKNFAAYVDVFEQRQALFPILDDHCSGLVLDQNRCALFGEIYLYFLGLDITGGKSDADLLSYLDTELKNAPSGVIKIVAGHKNRLNFNSGDKDDDYAAEAYDKSIQYGTLIVNAHSHTSDSMQAIVSRTAAEDSDAKTNPNDPASDHRLSRIRPGVAKVFVSGTGGKELRDQHLCKEVGSLGPIGNGNEPRPTGTKCQHFVSTCNSDQPCDLGAYFFVFNYHEDPRRVHYYYKDIQKRIIDEGDLIF